MYIAQTTPRAQVFFPIARAQSTGMFDGKL
jgi:hypothetical protein